MRDPISAKDIASWEINNVQLKVPGSVVEGNVNLDITYAFKFSLTVRAKDMIDRMNCDSRK